MSIAMLEGAGEDVSMGKLGGSTGPFPPTPEADESWLKVQEEKKMSQQAPATVAAPEEKSAQSDSEEKQEKANKPTSSASGASIIVTPTLPSDLPPSKPLVYGPEPKPGSN